MRVLVVIDLMGRNRDGEFVLKEEIFSSDYFREIERKGVHHRTLFYKLFLTHRCIHNSSYLICDSTNTVSQIVRIDF